jgi:hypothetical protein
MQVLDEKQAAGREQRERANLNETNSDTNQTYPNNLT